MPAYFIEESVNEERVAAEQAAARRKAGAAVELHQASERQRVVAEEQKRYDALVKELEVRYPEINLDSPGYNERIVAEIMQRKAAYEKQGMGSTQALRQAVSDLTGRSR